MLILIGYLIIFLCVFGGFALGGGHLAAIFQPIELMIIGGAAVGAFVAGNKKNVIMSVLKVLPSLFKGQKSQKQIYIELLTLLFQLLNKARQQGLMAVEEDIDNPDESAIFTAFPLIMKKHHLITFICDNFRLIITSNMKPFQLEALMDSEIEAHHEEAMVPANAMTKLGDGMPAFGIVAAVLGVVHTMESIDLPPSELGILVARALVGTFLGILIGYGFISPLASAIEQQANEEQTLMLCAKEVILASLHNSPPIMSIEFGRKLLSTEHRPSFNELNEAVKTEGKAKADAESNAE